MGHMKKYFCHSREDGNPDIIYII